MTANVADRSRSNGSSRTEWFNGWLDEWRWQRYGPNEDEKYEPLTELMTQ